MSSPVSKELNILQYTCNEKISYFEETYIFTQKISFPVFYLKNVILKSTGEFNSKYLLAFCKSKFHSTSFNS